MRPEFVDAVPSRVSRGTKIRLIGILVVAVVVFTVLPLILLAVPDPQPVQVAGLDGQAPGTYVSAAGAFYRLYPYSAPPFDFPKNALSVTDSRPVITIRYRQLDTLDRYQLQAYGTAAVVPIDKTVDGSARNLNLQPTAALQPGEYAVIAAKDGADAGSDYFYFRVAPE